MTAFEQYLFDKGFRPFKQVFFKQLSYEPLELNKISSFSTMEPGRIENVWIKDDMKIFFGLSEKGKPPTLISPRPKGIYFDDDMNRLLKEKTPEEIFKLIV